MDFVGDYKKQQRLAEALRGREKALLGTQIDTGPIVTQASGAFPGQVQANPMGALGQLGLAYFANKAGEKAGEAEDAAQEQRRSALAAITGGTPQAAQQVPVGGDVGPVQQGQAPMTPAGQMGETPPNKEFEMTPDNMLQLNEMGIDSGLIQMMKPEKEKLANFLQAIPNMSPELAKSMAVKFKIDPNVAEKAITDYWTRQDKIKADDFEQRKQLTLLGRPTPQPREPRQRDPLKELQAQYVTQLGAGDSVGAAKTLETYRALKAAGGMGGPGSQGGRGAKGAMAPEVAQDKITQLRELVKDPAIFDEKSQAWRKAKEEAYKSGGVPSALSMFMKPKGAEHAAAFDTIVSDFGLEKIQQLFPASDTDVSWIMSHLPSTYDTQSVASERVERLARVYEKAGSNGFVDKDGKSIAYDPANYGGGGQDAADALVNKYLTPPKKK